MQKLSRALGIDACLVLDSQLPLVLGVVLWFAVAIKLVLVPKGPPCIP